MSGKTAKGIVVSDASNVLVQGNTVDHNSNYGIYLSGSSAVTVTGNNVSFNAKQFERAASVSSSRRGALAACPPANGGSPAGPPAADIPSSESVTA